MRTQSMHEAYRSLLCELHHHSEEEVNSRTKTRIKMLRGGHSFKVGLERLPVPGNRKYFPRVAAAEVAWQLMGTRDPSFIVGKAPKLWEKFVEDGELKTAYGYRWREHFGRDQLELAIGELRDNPTNRQLFISAWDPASDGLGGPQPKNIPCPVGFTLSRTGDELHCSVFIRSSDVFVGLPYDVMGYALTTDAVAASVGCVPGTLHVTLAHPHVYEPHFAMVQACTEGTVPADMHFKDLKKMGLDHARDAEAMTEWADGVEPQLPAWTVEGIALDPEGYVAHVARLAKRVGSSDWNPTPEVIE